MAVNTKKGTIVVTGGNGGLGSAIAEQIASKSELSGYHGIYSVRDATKATALRSSLSQGASSHKSDIVSLDLTKLDNVRQVAADINTRVSAGEIPPIRALILNAGLIEFSTQSFTSDGLDTTFASNYLGHWLFTLLLLKSMDKQSGRIVVVGSQSHDPEDERNVRGKAFEKADHKTFVHDTARFDTIAKGQWSTPQEDSSWRSGFRRYGAAKLYLTMMVHELQMRLYEQPDVKNISVLGVDPGTMITSLQRQAPWFIRVIIFGIIYPIMLYLNPNGSVHSCQHSASDVLEGAFGTFSEDPPKDLYFSGTTPLQTSVESKDAEKRKLVWTETVRYADLKESESVLRNWQ